MTAAACTSHTAPAGTPTSAAPTLQAPSLDARGLVEQKALEAYRGMWAAYQKAGANADPADADLAKYTTGSALDRLVKGLTSVRDRGLVFKGEVALAPRVTSVTPTDSPTRAQITDCADDSKSLLYKKSGELYNDTPGGRRLVTATVEDTGSGVWKVTVLAPQGVGTC